MYEGWKLSSNLKPGWLEVVVYDIGRGEKLHETLVPQSRLNESGWVLLLRSLVCRFEGFGLEKIVSEHLNKRTKGPPYATNSLQVHITHPEPGVRRTYVGTNVIAWLDWVAIPESFRQG